MKNKLLFPALGLLITGIMMGCTPNNCDDKPANCRLAPDAGIGCFGHEPRYFYNQETGQCEEFIWSGAGGVVPFETMEECKACECN